MNKEKRYLDECLELSEANNLYNKIDSIYRLIIIQALQENETKTGSYFLKKLAHYVQFTKNPYVKVHAKYLEYHYLNLVSENYEEVLEKLTRFKLDMLSENKGMILTVLFDYEMSYSLWGLGTI